MEENMVVEEAKRSEQLNQRVTPAARLKLDEVLKRMGYTAEKDGHVKWDQDRLLEVLGEKFCYGRCKQVKRCSDCSGKTNGRYSGKATEVRGDYQR